MSEKPQPFYIDTFFAKIFNKILFPIRNLRNGAKILLTIILTIGIILFLEEFDILDIDRINFISLINPFGASKEVWLINGIKFNIEQLYFFLIILFNYWLFWGFKNKSDKWNKYRKPKDHKGVE